MKRKSLEHEECPLARSLEAIGDAWSVLIVREVFAGKRRLGEFEKGVVPYGRDALYSRMKYHKAPR